jgi:GT2 family glycosyltransferase
VFATPLSATFSWLALALLALAGHCFVLYPLSLRLLYRRAPAPRLALAGAPRLPLAICLCAYNEERLIVAKIERLLDVANAYGPATIHVYADAPSDSTVDLLGRFGDRIDLVVGEVRAGKTFGMNLLVARSKSDLILFTDANVVSDADCAIELARPFADPAIGCVTAHLIYLNQGESPTSAIGALYWRLEEAIKRIESDTVGVVGVDGAMFMIRRSLHRPPPPQLIDDLYLSLRVLIAGARIYSVDHVRVYERSAVVAVEEKQRKRRIACQAANVHRALWPELRRMPAPRLYAYLSHRVMKWLTPFLLAGAALSALAALDLAFGPAMASTALASALALLLIGHALDARPLSVLSSATLSLMGVAAGVLEAIFTGRTYTVWDPALSIRADAVSPRQKKMGETNAR